MIDQSPDDAAAAPFHLVLTDRRWLACSALLWLGCTAIYFLTAPGRLDIIDGAVRYEVTAALIESGLPVVEDPQLPAAVGRGGHRYSFYPLGTSLTAVPFVQIARLLSSGSLEAEQFAFSLTSVPFAAGVVAMMFLIFGRLGCPLRSSLNWALVVAFCTPLWVYAGSTFDTALQAFWLTLGAWAAVEALAGERWRWALVSGTGFAALVNIQETYVVLAACVADVTPAGLSALRRRLATGVVQIIGLVLLGGVASVMAYNAFKFGNPLSTGRATVQHPLIGNPIVGLAGLFVSPAKSIFLYSPTYLFALLGLRRLVNRDRERFGLLGACLAIHIALTASLRFWAGEWAWGPRYLVASIPLASIGLPFAARTAFLRKLLRALCFAGLLVQVLGISVDHQRYYFERSLTPFFWVDESWMYRSSPLFARPGELLSVLEQRDLGNVHALVPGPRPMSMTSSIFGPPRSEWTTVPRWMREFLVFLVPRPWPLWSRYLPAELRPGRTGLMSAVGCGVALGAFLSLFALVNRGGEAGSAPGPPKQKQMIHA